jgi:poly-gamma-glutamate synthesis protein (capsule biosynthesis protein)
MPDTSELTMVLVGDIMVDRQDPPSVFQHVRHMLRKSEFTFGNLEGVCADGHGLPWPKGGSYRLKETGSSGNYGIEPSNSRFEARQLTAVGSAGFDALTLANNHILDFGHEPLIENLAHLDRMGIAHAGAGRNFAEAHAPALVECKGCRVAMLGYTSIFMRGWEAGPESPGVAVMRVRTTYEPPTRALELPGLSPKVHTWVLSEDKDQLATDIAAARSRADIVVCAFHWGLSYDGQLPDYQTELGHYAIDVGADLVFGHHPHMLQGVEVYRGRAIFYSLGAFAFAHYNPTKGYEAEAMLVRCRIKDRQIRKVEYFPVSCDEKLNPYIPSSAEGKNVVDMISKRSTQFGTRFSPNDTAIEIICD